jgi:3-hydroxyisobutyrate dehydrogenase
MDVSLVGLGTMGWPMAESLLNGGHKLTIHDRDPARTAAFSREHDCIVAARMVDVAAAEVIITMLPDGRAVHEVLGDSHELAQLLRPGTIVIDMSSSDPSGTRALGSQLAARGVVLLDAPVSGTVTRARSATLTIMIGGDDRGAIERVKPLLECMGNRLFETGSLGCGHALKALNNFVAAAGYAAAAEALLIGRRFGLDPARMLEIMNVSTGRNFHTESVMPEHVVGGKFATGFTLGLLAKDVLTAERLAEQVRIDAPVVRLISERWVFARDQLGAARDNSEAILSWDRSLDERA